ncbi:tetratricopeptide repeat protein [Pseudomonadota bacterium]
MFSKQIKFLFSGIWIILIISCSGNSAIRASYEEHSKACESALSSGNSSVALESCQQAYNDTQLGEFDDEIKLVALNNLTTAKQNAEALRRDAEALRRNAEILKSYEVHAKACKNALATGNNDVALTTCQHAYDDTQLGKFDDSVKSAALYNLSTANRNAEKLELAAKYLEQSITLEEKSGEINSPELARRLSSLATIYAQLGNFYMAIPIALQLTPIVEANYSHEWQWLSIMLDDFVTEAINLNQEKNARLLQEASERLKSIKITP